MGAGLSKLAIIAYLPCLGVACCAWCSLGKREDPPSARWDDLHNVGCPAGPRSALFLEIAMSLTRSPGFGQARDGSQLKRER